MSDLSPRDHFLQVTLGTISHDSSQDPYVLQMLDGISDFVRDEHIWNSLSDEEHEEIQKLLAVVNTQMAKVAESKQSGLDPHTGEEGHVMDTHATQSYRGGLINALFRLHKKAEDAKKA